MVTPLALVLAVLGFHLVARQPLIQPPPPSGQFCFLTRSHTQLPELERMNPGIYLFIIVGGVLQAMAAP